MRAKGALLRQRRLDASNMRHCVRYCMGELPTSLGKLGEHRSRCAGLACQLLERPVVGYRVPGEFLILAAEADLISAST